ncbi:preprotein translocase subunit SecA [Candidatus Peregrinibacteria bacterium]|nr:MAG: preprotein translocase subunit SecA [Candidatus Peregrinibacteria bacterium]
MITKMWESVFGSYNDKYIKSLSPQVQKINKKEEEYQQLSEVEFLKNTQLFQERIQNGETSSDILIEAFATVKHACRRLTEKKHTFIMSATETLWEMIPFDVQLIGGIILHEGKIAEMKTGEGKTLVSSLPAYLNALEGKGVHLVTVNDYLASRDAEWMGQIFEYLGLTVGVVAHGKSPTEKREAYNCDITYGTNNEFGFDYLRDNMAVSPEQQVMRAQHYAILDEVDSILIDEARTPLIISTAAEESTEKYLEYAKIVKMLQPETHYIVDEKDRAIRLIEAGIEKVEEIMNIDNIYSEKGFETIHHLESAIKAQSIFQRDKDYVVKDGEIIIVDEFTGRLMPGRRYSLGLHQSIEAKEGVEVRRESKTLASITFQNYFRLYNKLSGMTGTAATEAEEFASIYSLDTIIIPTNKPIVRDDRPDAIFKSIQGKYESLVERVKEAHADGQPVLIGTISIEKSEVLSQLLHNARIPHNVLNAKHHEREAEIIMNAGKFGAVTIATNMAGRGTDIKLKPDALEAGGLLVIGTERHESRRIDNQLRGRSGRQGDTGETQFFISMDDDLLRLFGSEKMKSMMDSFGIPDNMPIENSFISKAIESAQKKVETRNFESRKHVLQYDDVMNKHREIVYNKRNDILHNEDIHENIEKDIQKYIPRFIHNFTDEKQPEEWNFEEIAKALFTIGKIKSANSAILKQHATDNIETLTDFVTNDILDTIDHKKDGIPTDAFHHFEKSISLSNIDRLWMEHIDEMSKLRETVSLQAYANKNPLFEYKHEAFTSLKNLLFNITINTTQDLLRVEKAPAIVVKKAVALEDLKIKTNEDQLQSQGATASVPRPTTPVGPITRADGTVVHRVAPEPTVIKAGRNDPCPCGSGKKYKKCHG